MLTTAGTNSTWYYKFCCSDGIIMVSSYFRLLGTEISNIEYQTSNFYPWKYRPILNSMAGKVIWFLTTYSLDYAYPMHGWLILFSSDDPMGLWELQAWVLYVCVLNTGLPRQYQGVIFYYSLTVFMPFVTPRGPCLIPVVLWFIVVSHSKVLTN